MKSSAKNIQITSYDDLFKTDEERSADTQERIQELPLDKLLPFPNHPFKVVDDEKMQDTVESITEYGVLVPILVRPKDDGNYEIVSGHRRHRASILAGKTEIPAIVRDMDDDAAILVMVDSNLQRETILPSEKAFAYKMKLEAMIMPQKKSILTMKGATIMEVSYRTEGDYRLPNILMPQQPEVHLGKYAELRRQYLMKYRRVLYTNLKTTAKLTEHLSEIERQATTMIEQITSKMAQNEGVTESLKQTEPMKWAGLMNNFRHSAEETVLSDLIYS